MRFYDIVLYTASAIAAFFLIRPVVRASWPRFAQIFVRFVLPPLVFVALAFYYVRTGENLPDTMAKWMFCWVSQYDVCSKSAAISTSKDKLEPEGLARSKHDDANAVTKIEIENKSESERSAEAERRAAAQRKAEADKQTEIERIAEETKKAELLRRKEIEEQIKKGLEEKASLEQRRRLEIESAMRLDRCSRAGIQKCIQDYRLSANAAIESCSIVVSCDSKNADGWSTLGQAYKSAGNFTDAESAFTQQLDIGKSASDRRITGWAYVNLGDMQRARGAIDAAERYYRMGIALNAGDRSLASNLYTSMAWVASSRGDLERADSWAESAINELDGINDNVQLALAHTVRANISGKRRDRAAMCADLSQAKHLLLQINHQRGLREIDKINDRVRCEL